jgi:hypothetical protein
LMTLCRLYSFPFVLRSTRKYIRVINKYAQINKNKDMKCIVIYAYNISTNME